MIFVVCSSQTSEKVVQIGGGNRWVFGFQWVRLLLVVIGNLKSRLFGLFKVVIRFV